MYRINQLYRTGKRLFTSGDLMLIWQTDNPNSLYTTIKRYVQKGFLFRIYKGLFSIVPLTELNKYELGAKLSGGYSYLSVESILVEAGIIFQNSGQITFAAESAKKLELLGYFYRFRRLQDAYLFNPAGIINKTTHFQASPERALADYLYFNPKAVIDNKLIDYKKLRQIQKEIGYI